jgi:proteasome lid subunit RPN8/RPN11
MRKETESGYSICQGGKVIALHHNHPSGNINPSKKDIETARQHNVAVCISASGKMRCYKPKGHK